MIKVCPICNNEFKTRNNRKIFCSKKCRDNGKELTLAKRKATNKQLYGNEIPLRNEELRKKSEQTNLERYGVKNPAQNKEIYEKIKQTNLKKYGVTAPSKNDDVKKKIEKTMMEKYGAKTNLMTEDCKERIKQTNLKKYGVEYPMQNRDILKKAYETNLKKYRNKRPLQNTKIYEKMKQTLLKNYNVDNPAKNREIYKKIKQTNLEKYGLENISQIHIQNFNNYNISFIKSNFIKEGYFHQTELMDYFNISYTNASSIKKHFNIEEPVYIKKLKTQQEIYEFIKNYYRDEITINNKNIIKPYELDIYISDKKLAIEYNGLLYHSYGKSEHAMFNNYLEEDKNYHLRKTEFCEKLGIKLFHIFENEWLDPVKREIWKSKIRLELGCIDRKFNARSCAIKTINNQELKEFLKLNHLQGYVPSSINLGLYYKDELIEVMTFGKSRFNKNYDYELLRNCTKINTVVRGGFSKLLFYFKKNYQGSIISYGNRRWTSRLKNVYGGNLINISEPNYFYFLKEKFNLISRQSFQKYKLKNKLENFDFNLSETENMYNNGYRKIFDCGNLVYDL